LVFASIAHDGRLAHHDPAIADVDQGVRGAEVDSDIAREEAEQAVEHDPGRVLVDRVGSGALASRYEVASRREVRSGHGPSGAG
jgi:hypothetical protein